MDLVLSIILGYAKMTENDCPICYESITQTTGCCILSCSHSFHIKCLTQWTSDASTCPMCRHSLTEIELVPKPPKSPERNIDFIIDQQSIENPSNSEVAEYMRNYLANRGSYVISGARPGEGRTSIIQGILDVAGNPQQNPRWFSIAPYIFTTEERITQVITEAGVTRNRAIQELRESAGNVDEAILMARDSHRYVPSTPPPIRNPLEPTDEMVTAWALERLFKYGTVIDNSYDYGSIEDTMHRTNVTRFSGHASSLWMNSDFIGAEVRDRSPSI